MPIQTYDIFFAGQTIEGADQQQVRQRVGQLFKANSEQLDALFSGNSVKVKSGVDEETASKYRKVFRDAGALIEIRPVSIADQEASSQVSDKGSLTLLPPNTGSLEGCAPKITPQQLPDISHLSLAAAGTTIDESDEPEPLEIDISELSMGPANSGSLEDCQKEVEPYPVPDISHLKLDKGK